MRFRPSATNLAIDLDTEDASEVVKALVQFFVPRYSRKVYFLSDQSAVWSQSVSGLSRVAENQEPSNFLRSCRVVQKGSELFVVAPRDSGFTQAQWRALADQLDAGAA